jgi:hypothetical protein
MSQSTNASLPHAPFPMEALRGIEHVAWGYSQYLRTFPANARTTQRIQTLERIQGHLAAQLRSGQVELVLNGGELEELLQTLQDFANVVTRTFPQDEQRDAVICAVESWRCYLIQIVQATAAC